MAAGAGAWAAGGARGSHAGKHKLQRCQQLPQQAAGVGPEVGHAVHRAAVHVEPQRLQLLAQHLLKLDQQLEGRGGGGWGRWAPRERTLSPLPAHQRIKGTAV